MQIDQDSRGQGRGYQYQVLHQPSFSLAVLQLQAEQSIQAESGAMVSMSANVELQSQMKGGIFGAIKRAAGGESAFMSTFTARGGPGELTLAPGAPGDIAAIELTGQPFFVQSSSYLAGDASLSVDTMGRRKEFLLGRGIVCVACAGSGIVARLLVWRDLSKAVAAGRTLRCRYGSPGGVGRLDAVHAAQSGFGILPQPDEW